MPAAAAGSRPAGRRGAPRSRAGDQGSGGHADEPVPPPDRAGHGPGRCDAAHRQPRSPTGPTPTCPGPGRHGRAALPSAGPTRLGRTRRRRPRCPITPARGCAADPVPRRTGADRAGAARPRRGWRTRPDPGQLTRRGARGPTLERLGRRPATATAQSPARRRVHRSPTPVPPPRPGAPGTGRPVGGRRHQRLGRCTPPELPGPAGDAALPARRRTRSPIRRRRPPPPARAAGPAPGRRPVPVSPPPVRRCHRRRPHPARPPKQRRRKTPPPVAPPPDWRPPKGYVPVPVRRRRAGRGCCCSPLVLLLRRPALVGPAALRPVPGQRGAAGPGRRPAAARGRTQPGHRRAVEDRGTPGPPARRGHLRRRLRTTDGKRVTVFGGTGFRFSPESDAKAEIARLSEQVPRSTPRCRWRPASGAGTSAARSAAPTATRWWSAPRSTTAASPPASSPGCRWTDSGHLLDTLREQIVTPDQS